jgi:hypothetical protein
VNIDSKERAAGGAIAIPTGAARVDGVPISATAVRATAAAVMSLMKRKVIRFLLVAAGR